MTRKTPDPIGDAVGLSLDEGIALIQLDDGKANAISHAVLDDLATALDRAEKEEARALVLAGREGRFSAGFDLSVMTQGVDPAVELALRGADLALRLYDWPVPVVLAVTGHALAMGGVLLLTADERIAADGPFKIGLNEVAIGLPLPGFALILARERLSRRHLYRATSAAEIYTPRDAIDAGYLDRVVPPDEVIPAALERAAVMAGGLQADAHKVTKRNLRREVADQLRRSIDHDRARRTRG